MTKVDIRRLDSVTTNDTTATQLINENFEALQTAIENTLSRDGSTPNFMDANLDLNSHKIINAGTPTDNTDLITKEYFDQNVGDASASAAAAAASAQQAQTYAASAGNYSSVATGAADTAQAARDFIESDPGFQAVSTDLLLGEDSSIKKTSEDLTNIDTVAGSIANVNAVGTDIAKVTAVADDLTNVDTVASSISDVSTVADDITSVNAVSGSIEDVNTVSNDITNINAVAADLTNIDAASGYAAESKQWAIGDPSEPVGNSAKYWAEYAQQETAGVEARVTTIEGKIPSTSTSSNKLTDKSYVDSQDNNLQTQIDAIVASSDVFDIVGTYAELQAYDISTVPVNDIIKVLVDSTHSNAATYYRCVESGGVKSWSYVGSEGPYYTKAEADVAFEPTLTGAATSIASSDLTASKALVSDANGKVAVSSVTSTELGYLAGVTSAIQTQFGNKANDSDVVKLTGNQTVAGEKTFSNNILANADITVNRNVALGSNSQTLSLSAYTNNGKLASLFQGWAETSRNTTGMYVFNSSGSYNGVAVFIDENGNKATYAPTPATTDNSTNIATTEFVINILKEIYPVGAIYIGTTSTCPLASLFGTWSSVSSGRVLQGADSGHSAGTTVEAGLPNITGSLAITSAQGFRNEVGVFSGAFKNGDALSASSGGELVAGCKADFDASLSSSIYGNSTTVQPPAYIVNIWQRTA